MPSRNRPKRSSASLTSLGRVKAREASASTAASTPSTILDHKRSTVSDGRWPLLARVCSLGQQRDRIRHKVSVATCQIGRTPALRGASRLALELSGHSYLSLMGMMRCRDQAFKSACRVDVGIFLVGHKDPEGFFNAGSRQCYERRPVLALVLAGIDARVSEADTLGQVGQHQCRNRSDGCNGTSRGTSCLLDVGQTGSVGSVVGAVWVRYASLQAREERSDLALIELGLKDTVNGLEGLDVRQKVLLRESKAVRGFSVVRT